MRPLYDSFVLFPLAGVGAPGFRVFPNTRALYSVRLWGPLPPLWADHFSLGVSGLGSFDVPVDAFVGILGNSMPESAAHAHLDHRAAVTEIDRLLQPLQ